MSAWWLQLTTTNKSTIEIWTFNWSDTESLQMSIWRSGELSISYVFTSLCSFLTGTGWSSLVARFSILALAGNCVFAGDWVFEAGFFERGGGTSSRDGVSILDLQGDDKLAFKNALGVRYWIDSLKLSHWIIGEDGWNGAFWPSLIVTHGCSGPHKTAATCALWLLSASSGFFAAFPAFFVSYPPPVADWGMSRTGWLNSEMSKSGDEI